MSPPRRRSSRLAAASAKRKATPDLPSVSESDNVNQPAVSQSPARTGNDDPAQQPPPVTPTASRLFPALEEMHPKLCHSSNTFDATSEMRLGFSDFKPGNRSVPGVAQETPSRVKGLPATEFTFRYTRGAADVVLSENAQRLMNELREHAVKIKADMRAQRDVDGEPAEERQIAIPKPKAGRFSAAHMAEFKKMDSIENHASVWRANRTPPSKPGIKRSHSKADLTETPTQKSSLKRTISKANLDEESQSQTKPDLTQTPTHKPSLKRTISKANLDGTPQSHARANITETPSQKSSLRRPIFRANLDEAPQSHSKPSLKRSSSRAKLDDGDSSQPDNVNFSVAGRPRTTPGDVPQSSFAKRVKKLQDDDASKSRPISRDGTGTPRPKSVQKSSNTKALGSDFGTPSKAPRPRLVSQSPSKPEIASLKKPEIGSLKKPVTTNNVASPSLSKAAELRRRIISPGSFQKVTSILRGQKSNTEKARTALPKPALLQSSQTPGPSRFTRLTDKELPPCPLTTPRRKLVKRVAFTPDTKYAAETQDSPSPQKFAMDKVTEPVQYPTLDGILSESTKEDVVYPDLSGLKSLTTSPGEKKDLPPSVPGTFTFRADHTIDFGSTPSGFGASPGQASLRHVRPSMGSKSTMPGSFPAPPPPSVHPNKENNNPLSPKVLSSSAHGLPNKKRHRAPSEEGDVDQEAGDRAAKKRKTEATPKAKTPSRSRTIISTPFSSVKKLRMGGTPKPSSASPAKRGGISMSRLNMLARPKNRG
ncbi:hypothetical protein ACO1O0_001405 [Amphichorda felina]